MQLFLGMCKGRGIQVLGDDMDTRQGTVKWRGHKGIAVVAPPKHYSVRCDTQLQGVMPLRRS